MRTSLTLRFAILNPNITMAQQNQEIISKQVVKNHFQHLKKEYE